MEKFRHCLSIAFVWYVLACPALDVEHFKITDSIELKSAFSLINRSANILCSFNATKVYVYFENNTSKVYQGMILKELNKCGTSFIALRNKYRTGPLGIIQNDGVFTYLVIMIKDASQRIDLSMVKRKSGSKHRSYFFVIVEDSTDLDVSWLRSAFEKFWDIWVLNAVIIFFLDNNIQIYTYSPFSRKFLRKLNSNETRRDDLFPPEMPNMNGRQLKICLYPDVVRAIFQPNGDIMGADGFMTWLVTSRLNATSIIQPPINGLGDKTRSPLSTNISFDFCLNNILIESSDLCLNTRFLSQDNFQNLAEHTVVYGRDDLCVIVPKALPASLFWNLFRSFQIAVWVVIVVMFLITYGLCRILLPHIDQMLIKLYSSMLSQPLKETPPKNSTRLFTICWLYYCLLISGAYKCNLTSNLLFRKSLPDINTLWELANSDYEILIYARHQKHIDKFLNSSIPYLSAIKQKAIPVTDDYLIKKLAENDDSYAYLEKFHVANFRVNSKKHATYGRPLFHLMDSCPIPFQSVYIVPYGSPYLGFLDTLVRRVHEHGFVHHWNRYMDSRFRHSQKSVIHHSRNADDPVVLRFAHLQAAFCLLGLGLALATGVLVWEIYGVYGIGTFVYNRQRWNAEQLKALRLALLKR